MKFSDIVKELAEAVPTPDTTDYKRLVGGGYNIKIVKCTEKEDKEYYDVVYDIAEGEYQDMFSTDYYADDADKDFRHHFIISYKNGNLSNVKRLIEVVEQSNPGFNWSGLDTELVGKIIGVVLQEEEYERNDGEVGVGISNFVTLKSTDEINAGDYKVPKIKKLRGGRTVQAEPVRVGAGQTTGASVFASVKDDDVPF